MRAGQTRLRDAWAVLSLSARAVLSLKARQRVGVSKWRASVAASILVACVTGCGSTTDSLGTRELGPLQGPRVYPNLFAELLGKTESEITSKVDGAFKRLFHGNPDTQAFYAPSGDAAVIVDSYNGDQRTEGYGLAMLIAVELDKQDEFDRIWRGAQRFRYTSGPYEGYYASVCNTPSGPERCVDPYGLQQFAMALLLANDLWKNAPSSVDYATAAAELLNVMLHKQDMNGGVVGGVTNTFEPSTKLVPHEPNVTFANVTRPSLVMPAYYSLWAQATGDSFFLDAASAARTYLRNAAHPTTGLTSVRTDLNGKPLAGFDTFQAESYRVQLNLMLDYLWSEQPNPASVLSDRLLKFFVSQGKDSYGRSFTLDGAPTDLSHDVALVAANGMSALAADQNPDRQTFVQAVWDEELPTGGSRYYGGLMQLLSMLALSGKLRVY